jgi:hypothetical protein
MENADRTRVSGILETSLPATQKQLVLLVSLSLKRSSVIHRYIKTEGPHIFTKIWELSQNSRRQKSDMQQDPY